MGIVVICADRFIISDCMFSTSINKMKKRKINFETAFTVLHRDLRVTMYIRKKMKIKIDRKFTQCTVYIWNWTPPFGKLKNLVSKIGSSTCPVNTLLQCPPKILAQTFRGAL